MKPSSSASISVINTRPGQPGEELNVMLEANDIHYLHHQALDIQFNLAENLDFKLLSSPNTVLIFVSKNAVTAFHALLSKHKMQFSSINPSTQWVAVGHGTASLLEVLFNIDPDHLHVPKRTDSEGVLDLPLFKQANSPTQNIVIVKGENGRQLMQQALSQAGHLVTEWSLYERLPINLQDKVDSWKESQILIATSSEIAQGLVSAISEAKKVDDKTSASSALNLWYWLVFSERIKQDLIRSGVQESKIFICEQMDNSSIIKNIQRLAK